MTLVRLRLNARVARTRGVGGDRSFTGQSGKDGGRGTTTGRTHQVQGDRRSYPAVGGGGEEAGILAHRHRAGNAQTPSYVRWRKRPGTRSHRSRGAERGILTVSNWTNKKVDVALTCPLCQTSWIVRTKAVPEKIQYCCVLSSCANYDKHLDWDPAYCEVLEFSEMDARKVEAEVEVAEAAVNFVNRLHNDNRLSYKLQERVGQTYQAM